MNKSVLLISALAALLAAGGLVFLVNNKLINNPEQQELGTTATLSTDGSEWRVGEGKVIKVRLDEITTYPALAFDLYFNYDPTEIEVEDVGVGSLWTGANVLLKKVDNDKGEVRFAAGQGFEASKTGDSELMTLKVRPLVADQELVIDMSGDSAIAVLGVDKEIFLEPTQYFIMVN